MTIAQWLIGAGIAVVVGWIILQPQRWGKRDDGSQSDGGNTTVGVHPDHRSHDDDADGDSDGGGDGGGD